MSKEAENSKSVYTCKRKRDVVTYLGVILFLFVIVFELYLVLWVPVQLKSQKTLEKEVAKQDMIYLADNLRNAIARVPTQNRTQDGEVFLAKSSLDGLAVYIRENQDFLSREQIRDLSKLLKSYDGLIQKWSQGSFFIKEEQLDCSNYVKALKVKAGLLEGSAGASNVKAD